MLFNPDIESSPRRPWRFLAIALAGALASGGLLAAEAPVNNNAQITLYGLKGDVNDAENVNRVSCTIEVPPPGAGRSIDVQLNNPGSNCYELRVEYIAMHNMPAATQVLLTDDYFCGTELGTEYDDRRDPSTNQNFWVKLRTTANGATLVKESISALKAKGFLTNVPETGGNPSNDVILEDYRLNGEGARMTYTLSCIRITSSTNKQTQRGDYVSVPAVGWHHDVKESESKDWTCPANQVITARKHDGDENATTHYKCASIEGLQTETSGWSRSFPECGFETDRKPDNGEYPTCTDKGYDNADMEYLYFSCPANEVMVGRSHKGDENAATSYQCAALYKGQPGSNNRVSVWPETWSKPQKESESEHVCPMDQVMVGRAHKGDENNETRYLCAKLRQPVASPI